MSDNSQSFDDYTVTRQRLMPFGPVTGSDIRTFREATGANTDDMYYILGNHGANLPLTGERARVPLQPGIAILVRYLINFPAAARLPNMPGFRYPAFDDVYLATARLFTDVAGRLFPGQVLTLSAPILGMICGLRRLAGPEWQRNENKRRAPASKRLLLHILSACEDNGPEGLFNYLACVDAEAYHRELDGLLGVFKRGHWDRQRFLRLQKARILGVPATQ